MRERHNIRVAITGANGNLGRKLIAALLGDSNFAHVRALDRSFDGFVFGESDRLRQITVDLSASALEDSLEGADSLVHLAAQNPFPDASWNDASVSFQMTARLAEASAKVGLRRFVFASSNHVMGGYKETTIAQSDGALTTDLPPRVGTTLRTSGGLLNSAPYAAAKLMGERLLLAKAELGAFTAVSLRIGWCQPGENLPETLSAAGTPKAGALEADQEADRDQRWFQAMWLSNADLVRCVTAAINAASSSWPLPAVVVNAVSANTPTPWDLSAGRKLISYDPKDNVWSALHPKA
jgi:nucleoside-diphosphate-sugar epimerase